MDQHWKNLLNALGVGIVIATEDWSLDFANRQALEIFDCANEDEAANRWDTLRSRVRAGFEAAPAQLPSSAGVDLDLPDEVAPRRLHLELFPLNTGSRCRALLLRDPERRSAENPDLPLMSRYHMLSRLYRSLRHDLKAPLQAMTLNLELLKTTILRNPAPDPVAVGRQQRYIRTLEEDLARLDRMLMSFLYQAVPPAQETPTRFCLRELLQETATLIGAQALKQRVEMDLKLGERGVCTQGHRDLLKQALLNLEVNALEAMAGGGRLTIKLETAMDRAIILIQDTGSGIPPEIVDRIWELNYTTRKTGSGIGLYVARSVIESHGGAIGVQTRDGQGSCFTLSLPIALEGG